MESLLIPFKLAKAEGAINAPYILSPSTARQTRFAGRDVLRPEIDFDRYRVEAVYDWVEIELVLSRVSQPQHLQRELEPVVGRKVYVTAIDGGTSRTTASFRIRFQDPTRQMLETAIATVDRKWGLSTTPSVHALEISVDIYPQSASQDDRQLMTGILQHHFLPRSELRMINAAARGARKRAERSERMLSRLQPRQAWGFGSYRTDKLRPDYGNRMEIRATFYIRGRDDDTSWRVQDKVTNQRKGAIAADLAPDERRSRVEVTLSTPALAEFGIDRVEDLYAFRGETLAGSHFSFWFPTVPASGARLSSERRLVREEYRRRYLKTFREMGVAGCLAADYQRAAIRMPRAGSPRMTRMRLGESGHLEAWVDLNDRMRRALQGLSL